MRSFNLFLLLGLFLSFLSCTKSSGENNNTGGGTVTAGPLFTAVRSIMQANCAVSGCHTNPNPQSGINLSDNNVIVSLKERIKIRSVDQAGTPSQMPTPPRAPLSTADRQKIVDWINAGGKISD